MWNVRAPGRCVGRRIVLGRQVFRLGCAKFTETFTIDGETTVIGTGAGTATKGAKVAITDRVTNGDKVTVSYHAMGTTLHASGGRVTAKGAKTAK
jgi:hypothetical protein